MDSSFFPLIGSKFMTGPGLELENQRNFQRATVHQHSSRSLLTFTDNKNSVLLSILRVTCISYGCLATGEGMTEKISEFQEGIEPTTPLTPQC